MRRDRHPGSNAGHLRLVAVLMGAALMGACNVAGNPEAADPADDAGAAVGEPSDPSREPTSPAGARAAVGEPSDSFDELTSPAGATTVWLDGEVPDLHPSVDGYPAGTVTLVAPGGDERHVLPVRVATTGTQRRHGLMEVPVVPEGTGMAFVWDDGRDRESGFWMKDTLVPLDIVYVRADGTIAGTRRMEPCVTDECPSYPPDDPPWRWTVEVAAGFLDRVGLTDGWRLAVEVTQ